MRFSGHHGAGSRNSYHHGNLREALINTALALIGERGSAEFAFSELARAVGVSPAAPYRHFRDRNALVAEIARRGFTRLTAELDGAWNCGRPDPRTAIELCGKAYLAFARHDPASFAVMFESGAALQDPIARRASERAFAVLRHAAECACETVPRAVRPPSLMVALHIWALSHGTAVLFAGKTDLTRRLPMPAEDLLEAGLLIYLQSLGLGQGATGVALG